jgi:hypothetical protein
MNVFEYTSANPRMAIFLGILAFLALAIAQSALLELLNFLFRIYSRTMRMMTIRKAGWPPEHCDADGDSVLYSD